MKNEVQRLKMETKHKVEEHIEIIGKLFPNTLTEVIKGYNAVGDPIMKSAIDFDVLRQELSAVLVEGPVERYQMNWPDKRKSILLANTPTNMTLRPCRGESVDFDSTENVYIEGNNLEVLKLLQETYLNKVKIIFIDPPYNLGKDVFVYDDNFSVDAQTFSEMSGKYDEDGNVVFDIKQNNETNGRYHTDWLNMIYPRIKLAKDLLQQDGVIFISIDDHEVDNLRKVCNEIFGENNFVNHIIWHKKYGAANDAKYLSDVHDHILLYCKDKSFWKPNMFPRPQELNDKYTNPDNDPRGPWIATNLSVKTYSKSNDYIITSPKGLQFSPPPSRCWAVSKERYEEMFKDNRITFGKNGDSRPYSKTFLSEVQQGIVPTTIWSYNDAGHNIGAKSELRELFSDTTVPFETPKPTKLIKRIITMGESASRDDIIMDFFSGSGTTADAVIQLNAEDKGKRKYVMVQLPEFCAENSQAYIAGYENICEIGKERIRRAGKKIKQENEEMAECLDIGFRVLKLDSSNMKDIYYKPNEYSQEMLGEIQENIKQDRTSEDLLFQVMLELGELLSSSIEECIIAGKKVFTVGEGNIIACFDTGVTEAVVIEIAKRKPYYAIFRDSSIATDSVAANFEQIFETYSPTTIRKVL